MKPSSTWVAVGRWRRLGEALRSRETELLLEPVQQGWRSLSRAQYVNGVTVCSTTSRGLAPVVPVGSGTATTGSVTIIRAALLVVAAWATGQLR